MDLFAVFFFKFIGCYFKRLMRNEQRKNCICDIKFWRYVYKAAILMLQWSKGTVVCDSMFCAPLFVSLEVRWRISRRRFLSDNWYVHWYDRRRKRRGGRGVGWWFEIIPYSNFVNKIGLTLVCYSPHHPPPSPPHPVSSPSLPHSPLQKLPIGQVFSKRGINTTASSIQWIACWVYSSLTITPLS